jgi:hypothetical protein
MSNYGRNFEFRVSPQSGQRASRYATQATAANAATIPIGAPIKVLDGTEDTAGRLLVELGAQGVPPHSGYNGIAIFEYAPAAFAGDDPFLTVYADKVDVPDGVGVQMVSGKEVKVVLRNTATRTFLHSRTYTGKTMVAGAGATPTVAVGNYLEPHSSPSDTNGYWVETATAANAWLLVTKVDTARGEVEARMLF